VDLCANCRIISILFFEECGVYVEAVLKLLNVGLFSWTGFCKLVSQSKE
jgi:hypothetical protein